MILIKLIISCIVNKVNRLHIKQNKILLIETNLVRKLIALLNLDGKLS